MLFFPITLYLLIFFAEVLLIYNVVANLCYTAVTQIYIDTLFSNILFHYSSSQDIGQVPVLYSTVCVGRGTYN